MALSHRRSERGQNLVLFALTTLFLTVMVLGSLSLSTRIKERMEAQMLADAAAYNQATHTARAFNSLSLMNRVQVAQMSSLASVEALVSWSAFYGDALAAYGTAVDGLIGPPLYCNNSPIYATRGNVNAERSRILSGWATREAPTGVQARNIQAAAMQLGRDQDRVWSWYRERLTGIGTQESIPETTVRLAVAPTLYDQEMSAFRLRPADNVTAREVQRAVGASGARVIDMVHASMAARAYWTAYHGDRKPEFVWATGHNPYSGQEAILELLRGFSSGPIRPDLQMYGTTAYASGMTPTHGNPGTEGDASLLSETHGLLGASWPNRSNPARCPRWSGPVSALTEMRNTAAPLSNAMHSHGGSDSPSASVLHRLNGCGPAGCPSLWPIFIPYSSNAVRDEDDLWGQPKSMVVVQRDYARRRFEDPWNLDLRFGLDSTAQRVDMKKETGDRRQIALSTGLTYFHRGRGHWREPPNFLNPWWNATLVRPDIDERRAQRGDDVVDVLRAVGKGAGAAQSLRTNGFRGWQ